MSLGRCFAGHSLEHKLDMARKYGFRAIEVFYEDLVDLANSTHGDESRASQVSAAKAVRQMCRARGQTIICLQPFMHFGGLNRAAHAQRIDELRFWMQLAHALDTDLVLFPSSYLPESKVSPDMDVTVRDFQEAADIALHAGVRLAFEALCWGTRVDTWQASWDIVRRVDRPNFGLCLDSFNIAGRIYADPGAASGKVPNWRVALSKSLSEMQGLDMRKVFLVQVADAERLSRPLDENHEFYQSGQPARMSWSRNARLFYGEEGYGAYLPVREILDAVLRTGYKGWMSFEVFNRALVSPDASVPEVMARRAAASWDKMVTELGIHSRTQPML